jgi:hypothetical protein
MTIAAIVAPMHPIGGMTLICFCLVVYFRREAPSLKMIDQVMQIEMPILLVF